MPQTRGRDPLTCADQLHPTEHEDEHGHSEKEGFDQEAGSQEDRGEEDREEEDREEVVLPADVDPGVNTTPVRAGVDPLLLELVKQKVLELLKSQNGLPQASDFHVNVRREADGEDEMMRLVREVNEDSLDPGRLMVTITLPVVMTSVVMTLEAGGKENG